MLRVISLNGAESQRRSAASSCWQLDLTVKLDNVVDVWKKQRNEIVRNCGIVLHWLVKQLLHQFQIFYMHLLRVKQFYTRIQTQETPWLEWQTCTGRHFKNGTIPRLLPAYFRCRSKRNKTNHIDNFCEEKVHLTRKIKSKTFPRNFLQVFDLFLSCFSRPSLNSQIFQDLPIFHKW